jgi:predicted nucleic acid-binding protein
VILLDTNIISELMRPEPAVQVKRWLSALGDESLATTAVTVAEITFGLARLPEGARRADLERRFAALVGARGLTIVSIDEHAGRLAGLFLAARTARGAPATMTDMLIAGAAGAHAAPLATRNATDFEHLPIIVINPWQ